MLVAGEVAPEIVLSDSSGALWRLSERVTRGPAVLLFYRGHW
jgi:peroxiredoxin